MQEDLEREQLVRAIGNLQRGEVGQAEEVVTRLLVSSPNRPDLLTLRGLIWERKGESEKALASYRWAMAHDASYPDSFNKAERVCRAMGRVAEANEYQFLRSRPGSRKSFSILLLCYGDFPEISLRALESILSEPNARLYCDIHVGLNECSARVSQRIMEHYNRGEIDLLIHSRRNINKDPMWRLLLDNVTTPYFLWMDDDSYLHPGWRFAIQQFIDQAAPFDLAGHIHHARPHDVLADFIRQRPWVIHPERVVEGKPITFVVGGAIMANTERLHQCGFPDRKMLKAHDDIMLGELVAQVGGKLVQFTDDVLNHLVIDAEDRRAPEMSYTK